MAFKDTSANSLSAHVARVARRAKDGHELRETHKGASGLKSGVSSTSLLAPQYMGPHLGGGGGEGAKNQHVAGSTSDKVMAAQAEATASSSFMSCLSEGGLVGGGAQHAAGAVRQLAFGSAADLMGGQVERDAGGEGSDWETLLQDADRLLSARGGAPDAMLHEGGGRGGKTNKTGKEVAAGRRAGKVAQGNSRSNVNKSEMNKSEMKTQQQEQHGRVSARVLAAGKSMGSRSIGVPRTSQELRKFMEKRKRERETKERDERLAVDSKRRMQVLPCAAVCCRVLPCVAVCCRVLPCAAVCCHVLPCVAVCFRGLPCVAVCCSVFPWVAVCCSVLQCVAVGCRGL